MDELTAQCIEDLLMDAIRDGLVEVAGVTPNGDRTFRLTEKGVAYVESMSDAGRSDAGRSDAV